MIEQLSADGLKRDLSLVVVNQMKAHILPQPVFG